VFGLVYKKKAKKYRKIEFHCESMIVNQIVSDLYHEIIHFLSVEHIWLSYTVQIEEITMLMMNNTLFVCAECL
jgi:hypothetical protein